MIDLIPGVQASTAALHAERIRLDVVAQNIANTYTTRGVDGRPYQRQQVVFEAVLSNALDNQNPSIQPRVARVEKDTRPPLMIHNPGHPDANEQGMVAMPNINLHEEMADMMIASRTYEANLAVIKNARAMAMSALTIGRK